MRGSLVPVVVFLALVGAVLPACAANVETCMTSLRNESPSELQTTFRAEAERFLRAVKTRDRATFDTFFDPRVAVTALLPGGKKFTDLASFLKSQDGWFAGTTGRFDAVIERTDASGDLGFLWARATYANSDDGGPFELDIYLTFVFRRIDGRWFLTHDQNTVVSDSRR